ncbi:hypothetical protein [Arthrobacter subterraneus]|nr:hypothetical protein [Arthrobacter subterraneus]
MRPCLKKAFLNLKQLTDFLAGMSLVPLLFGSSAYMVEREKAR